MKILRNYSSESYGQTADLKAINLIANKYKIHVIEDAAQSFGAKHHNEFSCSQTTLAATSFFPSKPLDVMEMVEQFYK